MSWLPDDDPECVAQRARNSIETLIIPRARDLGGFAVRRVLPSARRQMIGPFIFFDQMGPADFPAGSGIDVRPHPHIGLGTVTYLYQGAFQHRDSLGSNQMIYPGEVNWMLAGRGVTHSERTSAQTRQAPHALSGIQTWVALPADKEDLPPAFEHHTKDSLPFLEDGGIQARLILGTAWGHRAPVTMHSEIFYIDITLAPGAAFPLPDEHEDRGLYISQGSIEIAGETFEAGRMIVFRPGDKVSGHAGPAGARLMALGGASFNEPRYVWWNFVSSSPEKIDAAKAAWKAADWQTGPFRLPPGDEDEFIPITEDMERIKIKKP